MAEKKTRTRRYVPLLALLLLAAALLATYFIMLPLLIPVHYDLQAGDTAPQSIYAPRVVSDMAATAVIQESARNNTPAIYYIDEARVNEMLGLAESFFFQVNVLREDTRALMVTTGLSNLTAAQWEELLSDDQRIQYAAMTMPALSETHLYAVLAADNAELLLLKNVVLPKIMTTLNAGLSAQTLESVKSACKQEIEASSGLNKNLQSIGASVFDAFLDVTYIVDEQATQLAREQAAAAVEMVQIAKGELIVESGATVTDAQIALLSELGMVGQQDGKSKLYVGAAVYLLCAYLLFGLYLIVELHEVFLNIRQMIILCVLMMVSVLVARLSGSANAFIGASALAIMLTALLICEKAAFAFTLLLSLTLGLVSGVEDGSLFGLQYAAVVVSTLATGIATVYALKRTQSRGSMIAAGAIGGAVGAVALLSIYLLAGVKTGQMLADMGWCMGSAILCALLVVGSLAIWENIFDVATSARLNELLNSSQPLLRQMMTDAPGTYQHSINVASLAENAAQRVGANPLLARVGAMYHDMGKLRRPLYFMENQKPGENIHDTLAPLESASSIIAHQKDGGVILSKYGFPSSVINIVTEHHGNSLMAYFYHKALQRDNNVSAKGFRYQGNKPSTQESAIIMLADSCEAAVRSLGEGITREAREEMVHKVIWGKMTEEDNQLSAAPLTLQQISEIERSFLKTFNGIMHDRIEYPGQEPKRS